MRKNKRTSDGEPQGRPAFLPQGQFAPENKSSDNAEAADSMTAGSSVTNDKTLCQKFQTNVLHVFVLTIQTEATDTSVHETSASNVEISPQSGGVKRKHENDDDVDDFNHDKVRLWEDGYKERYYENKFGVHPSDEEFRSKVATEYVRGLSWVLQYYYQVSLAHYT